jgi:hypothetical protein
VNLELPFADADASSLDDCFAAIDRELDALFLGEVDGALQRIREEQDDDADPAAA